MNQIEEQVGDSQKELIRILRLALRKQRLEIAELKKRKKDLFCIVTTVENGILNQWFYYSFPEAMEVAAKMQAMSPGLKVSVVTRRIE